MHVYSFETLEAWKLARNLRKEVYFLTRKFPKEENFGLINQLKRSTSSIGACLAEGSGKNTAKDQAHYSNLAYATSLETLSHLICAMDIGYITDDEYTHTRKIIENVTFMITRLRNAQLKRII